ncbi:MAG: hypothetical protein A2017_22085 [Lentisphaerae bacterium GWF2_44_16]|nr:MAG: hypothetical protein A2017_22085 [Lentisphaerae bacterium GWF2_44_16]
MKFDKETIIVLAICFIVLMAWQPICEHMGWIKAPATETVKNKIEKSKETVSSAVPSPDTDKDAKEAAPSPLKPENISSASGVKQLPEYVLSNNCIEITINPNMGSVSSVRLKKFFKADRKDNIVLDKNIDRGALEISWTPSGWTLTNIKTDAISKDEYHLTRTFTKGDESFQLIQEWKLPLDDYIAKYRITVRNTGAKTLSLNDILVNAGGIAPLHSMTGDIVRSETHCIEWCNTATDKLTRIDAAAKEQAFNASATEQPLSWISISNKYFASILLADETFTKGNSVFRKMLPPINGTPSDLYTISSSGRFNNLSLPPGSSENFNLKYFTGPKELALLKKLSPSTPLIMHLSFWYPLEMISQWLLVALVYLKNIFGSYGISIIILTIIVRAAFWPVTQRANKSMQKMQKIQPMVQEIRTKYKDNPQILNSKIMGLYKEQKVNPLGGCLPILLQLPVFFALYSTLDGAVELRQTSFLWCHDLSMPDTIASIFGLGIHPLIIAMTLLMVVQQKITPASPDPMQQKMMMFMPLIMLVFLYNLPSGLTLYWTVSQIISIIQLYINKRAAQNEQEKAAAL